MDQYLERKLAEKKARAETAESLARDFSEQEKAFNEQWCSPTLHQILNYFLRKETGDALDISAMFDEDPLTYAEVHLETAEKKIVLSFKGDYILKSIEVSFSTSLKNEIPTGPSLSKPSASIDRDVSLDGELDSLWEETVDYLI